MAENNGHEPKWIPLQGNWSFQGTNAKYEGSDDPQLPVGVLLSSTRIRNGRISANIRLNKPEQGDVGRILLGYDAATENYYSVGLGGYGRAYLIDECTDGRRWQSVRTKGIVSHLDGESLYKVEVDIRGQMLSLSVDGIEVVVQQLPSPFGREAGRIIRLGTRTR